LRKKLTAFLFYEIIKRSKLEVKANYGLVVEELNIQVKGVSDMTFLANPLTGAKYILTQNNSHQNTTQIFKN